MLLWIESTCKFIPWVVWKHLSQCGHISLVSPCTNIICLWRWYLSPYILLHISQWISPVCDLLCRLKDVLEESFFPQSVHMNAFSISTSTDPSVLRGSGECGPGFTAVVLVRYLKIYDTTCNFHTGIYYKLGCVLNILIQHELHKNSCFTVF